VGAHRPLPHRRLGRLHHRMAWLHSFTGARSTSAPPLPPPPVTVTMTVTQVTTPSPEPVPSLPEGTDGAAQAACTAHAQAVLLHGKGRRTEAAIQRKAAEEAAFSSAVPAHRALKGREPREVTARLGDWCTEHFPDAEARTASPRPTSTRGGSRSPLPPVPETAPTTDSLISPGCRTPAPGSREPEDPECAGR
jgi:hypothetical protein